MGIPPAKNREPSGVTFSNGGILKKGDRIELNVENVIETCGSYDLLDVYGWYLVTGRLGIVEIGGMKFNHIGARQAEADFQVNLKKRK